MEKLHEHDIAQAFIGKTYDRDKLSKVAKQNAENRYIAECHTYKNDLLDLFGITSTLLENWGYHGIELSIFITIKDNKIENCGMDKCKCSCSGHGRPKVKVLHSTQQEIRIFKRIMENITKTTEISEE